MKDSIALAWEPPTNNGGSDITAYIIEKRDAKRNTYTQVEKVTGLTNTYAVQKLLEGNEYYFRVSAENEIGKGEPAEMDKPIMAKCPFGMLFFSFYSRSYNSLLCSFFVMKIYFKINY